MRNINTTANCNSVQLTHIRRLKRTTSLVTGGRFLQAFINIVLAIPNKNMNKKNKDARKKSTNCTVRLPRTGNWLSSIVMPVNVKPLRRTSMFIVFAPI